MQTLKILIGPPGCGKSTYASNLLKLDPGTVVVCKDAIRSMYCGGEYVFRKELETAVQQTAHYALIGALALGFDVIVDETNMKRATREGWLSHARCVAKELSVHAILFEWTDLCKVRRMQQNRGIPKEQWARVWDEKVSAFEPISNDERKLYTAIIRRTTVPQQDRRVQILEAQVFYCKKNTLPVFMPADGICSRCHNDFTDKIATIADVQHITGCPVCNASFVN